MPFCHLIRALATAHSHRNLPAHQARQQQVVRGAEFLVLLPEHLQASSASSAASSGSDSYVSTFFAINHLRRQFKNTDRHNTGTPNHPSHQSFRTLNPFKRAAPLKTFNCAWTTRSKLALLYWNHRRSDKRR
ncbi:MAG TPA: hypothetical protein VJ733_15375 [Candidatus Binatia bacterium]|nr:hypothetical protein [Candidatus Binatia bacterium]